MDFEYDPKKSDLNKSKHGIDFEEARGIWEDQDAIQLDTKAIDEEERFLIVGSMGGLLWTAVITYRGEIIRIISVRRARGREVKEYDQSKGI